MKKEEEIHEMDAIKDAVQRMSIFSAQLYYHLTKQMVDDYGKEAATETIKKAIREFGLERGSNIRQKCLDAGVEPTIHNLHPNYDILITEGWSPESKQRKSIIVENENDVIEDGCTKNCIFADYWMSRDWADIGYLYCAADDAIREAYNPDILYVPEKNIIKGDDSCTAVSSYRK